MPRLALKRPCAVLAHSPRSSPPSPAREIADEAARMAALAGAFGLFGLAIAQPERIGAFAPADFAYRVGFAEQLSPANDSQPAPRAPLPKLSHRRAHIDAGAALSFIQALDWVVVALTAHCTALWGAGANLTDLPLGQAAAFVCAALALKGGLWLTETYRIAPSRLRPEHGIGGLALGAIGGVLIGHALAADASSAAALTTLIPLAAMVLAGLHGAFALWVGAAHRAGWFAETVVLIGATESAVRLARLAAQTGEARIIAIVDDRRARTPEHIGDLRVSGEVASLLAWDGLAQVDRIVIALPAKAEARVRALTEQLAAIPNRIDLLLDIETSSVQGRRFERFSGVALARLAGGAPNQRRATVKRVLDLVLAAALLSIFAAPMALIALAVRLDSKGPILFLQARYGFNNRVFQVLKFRIMHDHPNANWRPVKANDARFTRVGAFLRRTGLDDIPLLFNVLLGQMSLIGPRPHAVAMKIANRAPQQIAADYAHRHRVKPGILGWAQANGAHDGLRTFACLRRRLRFDLDYAANASLWFDLLILLRGVLAPLMKTQTPR